LICRCTCTKAKKKRSKNGTATCEPTQKKVSENSTKRQLNKTSSQQQTGTKTGIFKRISAKKQLFFGKLSLSHLQRETT
jgi:hypothetical protein